MQTEFLSATKLIRALRQKKIGALELLDHYAKRIGKYDGVLNALPVLDLAVARKRAKAFDRRGAKPGVLAGLPMTVKESFDLAGHPSTWGLAEYRAAQATSNAVAVERFLRAGGNVFGKSNVPVLLADWETANPVYGKTVNPWNHARTPGGSSAEQRRRSRRGSRDWKSAATSAARSATPRTIAASTGTSRPGASARWPGTRCPASLIRPISR